MDKEQVLAQIASHICHELASPITALSSAFSFMEQDGANAGAAQEVLGNSINSAHYLVQFLRQCFGSPSLGEGHYDLGLAEDLSRHHVANKNRNPSLDWQLANVSCTGQEARYLLNMVALVSNFLPRGGCVYVRAEQEANQLTWIVGAKGPRIAIREEVRAALSGEMTADRPVSTWIGAYYLFLMANNAGAKLAARDFETSDDGVSRCELVIRLTRTPTI